MLCNSYFFDIALQKSATRISLGFQGDIIIIFFLKATFSVFHLGPETLKASFHYCSLTGDINRTGLCFVNNAGLFFFFIGICLCRSISHKHHSQGCRQLLSVSAETAALVPRTHFTWPITNQHPNACCFWVPMHSFEKKMPVPSVHNFNTVFLSNSPSFDVWMAPAVKWKISQCVVASWSVAGRVMKFASQLQKFLQSIQQPKNPATTNMAPAELYLVPWFHFCTFQIT